MSPRPVFIPIRRELDSLLDSKTLSLMRFSLMLACAMLSFGLQAQNMVTFQVDMSGYTGSYNMVNLNGSFNGWCGECIPMSDSDGDGVYDVTVDLAEGVIEYKFTVDGWSNQENFAEGTDCTSTVDGYTNRTYNVAGDTTLDVVCWNSCGECQGNVDVTFNVDMTLASGATEVYLAGGTLFGWPGDNPMSDADGDGIWTITMSLPVGTTSNYTFLTCQDWGCKEDLNGQECADPSNYNDRTMTVPSAPATLDHCFADCDCSGPPSVFYDLTLNVNTQNIEVGPNGMYAGGGVLGDAQAIALSDDDGDDIWSATISLAEGTAGNYIFLNSPNDGGDWNAKEVLAGLECSDPNNYDDRILPPLTEDTVISTCFGQCSTDGSCEAPASTYDVTFRVDMAGYAGSYGTVNLNGSFAGWCGECIPMSDDDSDGVYEVTIALAAGTFEYKFTVDGWADQETFAEGTSCTSTINGYTNRTLEVTGDVALAAVCWNTCDSCEAVSTDEYSLTFQVDMSQETTNPIGVFIAGNFQGWDDGATAMSDEDGDDIWEYTTTFVEGQALEFKYINGPNWGLDESIPAECASNNNRVHIVGSSDAILDAVCFGSCAGCASASDELAGTQWKLYPGAGALGVGPNQGDNSWWSNTSDDVVTRACLFDDIYAFNADGSFQNILGGETWLEGWQGVDSDQCGTPVAPHDGLAEASWSHTDSELTLNGTGAFMGLAKVFNGGELSNPADAPASITYVIESLTDDAMTLDINFGAGWWRFRFVPVGTELTSYDLTLEVNTANIEVGPNGMFAGGGVLGDAQALALSDDDGDGIWSGTVSLPEGTSGNYIFLNSPNDGGDWGAKENLDGLECSDPANYNDRILAPLTGNTTISTCFGQCSTDGTCAAPADTYDVTFQVDMSSYEGDFGTVNLNGNFNGWCGGCAEMTDADGDGVYSLIVPLPAGSIEYKFTLDGWTAQEEFAAGESCTVTDGTYVNRGYEVVGEAILDVVCYNSCSACDGSGGGGDPVGNVSLTFNVNTANIEVGPNGIYLGGGVFGDAQAHAMSDDDNDGVWSVTLEVANGLSGNYIFLNSPNDGGDWGAKENLAGLECADPANFDDRILAPVTEDTVLSTCFGQCSTDGSCAAPPATYDVTFRVDMSTYEAGYGTVNLNGSFNGWCGGCTEMTDNDGDMVYEVTVALAEGTFEYKFTLDGWTAQEEFDGSEACVSTIDGYNNRSLDVAGEAVLDVVCWNSCEACVVIPEVLGCTNPEFLEYDPYATSDDGSCSNLLVSGCMYENATNYNPLANDDDNSCEFEDGGNNDCPADLDGDGAVTTSDLLSFLAEFGASCS